MATYNHLPVYKTSYDLLVEIFQFTKNFNKELKFILQQGEGGVIKKFDSRRNI